MMPKSVKNTTTTTTTRSSRPPLVLLLGLLFLISVGLLFVGHKTLKREFSFSATTTTKRNTATITKQPREADGCHHVFIDGGANIGVHGRFLLEPEKYPDARVAHTIFNREFGANRDNRDFCVFEFEPNPAHYPKLRNNSDAYAQMGWRYHAMNVGLSDRNGTLPFYRRNDVVNEEWGFSVRKFFEGAEQVDVPIIRFSKWLQDHVLAREMPTTVYGTYPKNATIVVKLDTEGSEYVVLPDLISSGAFCQLDYVFGEFHSPNAPYKFPGLNVAMSTPQEIQTFERAMMLMIKGFSRTCKTRFDRQDDEAYLHDGIPLPTHQEVGNSS